MALNANTKTYNDTFIFSYANEASNKALERNLITFVHEADRINPADSSFKPVLDDIKLRQTTTVFYKLVMRKDVVLCVFDKEMPASLKVFVAKDIRVDKKRRVFIDCTGLIKYNNGFWTCKEIDKLCSYLFAAMINLLYSIDPLKITSNSSIVKASTQCFAKMFTGILDNLRTINFEENRTKIFYITAVYYLYNVMGKDIGYSRSSAMSAAKISPRDAMAYDIYYDAEKDLINIDTFVKCITDTFHLKDLTTAVMIDRWSFVYGKGTMYGMEYLPAFLDILAYAYVGAYLNNQKSIELICRADMVETATMLLKVGAEEFNTGASMLEAALENRLANRPVGLTEAQEEIIVNENNFNVRVSNYQPYVDGLKGSSAADVVWNVPKIRKEVNGIVASKDMTPDLKIKKLDSLKTNLKRGKTYRTDKQNNAIPIASKAIKIKFFDQMLKIVDNAKEKITRSTNESADILEEGYLNQLAMSRFGGKTPLWKILKDHKYDGLLKAINSCKDQSDIAYLRRDISSAGPTLNTIRENIKKCEHGKTPDNAKVYDRIKKLYLDHDVTVNDVDLYAKWLKTDARNALNEKSKELKARGK